MRAVACFPHLAHKAAPDMGHPGLLRGWIFLDEFSEASRVLCVLGHGLSRALRKRLRRPGGRKGLRDSIRGRMAAWADALVARKGLFCATLRREVFFAESRCPRFHKDDEARTVLIRRSPGGGCPVHCRGAGASRRRPHPDVTRPDAVSARGAGEKENGYSVGLEVARSRSGEHRSRG